MDDLKLLKERIYDEERIEEILEELGCGYIKSEKGGRLYTASLPNGDNRRSCQVKNNENLTSYIRSKGISGDIFALVGYILFDCTTFEDVKANLYRIKGWICNTLGYEDILKGKIVERPVSLNWNSWLKEVNKLRSDDLLEIQENRVLDENILDEFFKYPNLWWHKEGINTITQGEFEVGFDLRTLRITFPVRNKEGKLIGVKGRYVGKDQFTLDHQKYIYIVPCNKSIELFNLHKAMPFILKEEEVIVVEGAKSVMLLHQWGFKNVVSIEGDHITPAQVKLLKELDLSVNLTFAWDKDKSIDFIKEQLKPITGRKLFCIFDKDELLSEKDSPIDKGFDVWYNLLANNKYKISGG